MGEKPELDQVAILVAGYLRKYAVGHEAARPQAKIAYDLRRLGIETTARQVREACSGHRFQDLAHLVSYVEAGGEHLPPDTALPELAGDKGGPLLVRAVVKHATTWPEVFRVPAGADADAAAETAQAHKVEGGA